MAPEPHQRFPLLFARSMGSTGEDKPVGRSVAFEEQFAALAVDEPTPGELLEERVRRDQIRARMFSTSVAPKIGRYRVLNVLGEGGMGIVYGCFDESLERRVALKLVRGDHTQTARRRMLREARAMAKLSHPNVVPVFEVGEHEGQLFVAMEFIKGTTLFSWQSQDGVARPWKDVLAHYLQAGRGLAAAHAEGLVHRDFKPHNAIVGLDGRVRVLDFGLASVSADVGPAEDEIPARGDAFDTFARALTRTGALVGTPAYMAPEQSRGEALDARGDQFAYCVSLWEALFGSRPFDGATPEAVCVAAERGAFVTPANSRAPARLRQVLERGLAARPADRWPDMLTLLARLERLQKRGRRLALGAAGILLSSLSTALLIAQSDAADEARIAASAAREESARAQVREATAKAAASEAEAQSDNALRVTRASLLMDAPTEAAALLREVEGDPRAVPGWLAAATLHRDRLRNLRAVLEGHAGTVFTAKFLPDGERVATAGVDGLVRIFAIDGEVATRVLSGHTGMIWDLDVSPDGRYVATGSFDGTVRLFSVDESEPAVVFDDHTNEVYTVEFSPDGRFLVSASDDHTARIVSVDGASDPVVLPHDSRVHVAVFSPDSRWVGTGSADGTVRRFSIDGRSPPQFLPAHDARVVTVAFSHGGRHLASGGFDNVAHVVDLDAPEVAVVLRGHTGPINAVRFAPDDTVLATASDDHSGGLFASDGSTPIRRLQGHTAAVRKVAFAPDGRRVVTASNDGTVRVFNPNGDETMLLSGHTDRVRAARYGPDGTHLVTASADGTARVFATEESPGRTKLQRHPSSVWEAAFFDAGQKVVTVGGDGIARVFAVDQPRQVDEFTGPGGPVVSVAVSPDGGVFALACEDGTVRTYDANTFEPVEVLSGHEARVTSVRFSVDGRQIVSGSADNTARIFTLGSEDPSVVLPGHSRVIRSAAFSPDGAWVVTACSDGIARIFSVAGGPAVVRLEEHLGPVYAAAFSPDGSHVVTGAFDGVVRIFPREGGSPLELTGNTATITAVEYSPDGKYVLTAGLDGTARLFVPSGDEPPILIEQHGAEVYDARFSPDGTRIVTVSSDKRARIFETRTLLADLRPRFWSDPYCHAVRRRMRLLAETEDEARRNYKRCRELTRLCTADSNACATEVAARFGR